MAYTPPWERLPEALVRVREATRLSQTEAQADICRAISDGAIKIQGALGRRNISHMTSRATVLDGNHFQIPRNLKPTDFDWANSRPLEPWFVRRESFKIPGHWYLDWIELLKIEVTNALCVPEVGDTPAQKTQRKDGTKRRSRPAFDRAQRAITTLYPAGVPPEAEVPNAVLCGQVGDWLKANELLDLSDDTILRAAGRRRK